jgi:hypothetical protein
MSDASNATILRDISAGELDARLDIIVTAGRWDPGELDDFKAEIEHRKIGSFNKHRDREQFEWGSRDPPRCNFLYLDVATASLGTSMLEDAKRDLDRKQALINKRMDVRHHLTA